jgi:hypothetical protein
MHVWRRVSSDAHGLHRFPDSAHRAEGVRHSQVPDVSRGLLIVASTLTRRTRMPRFCANCDPLAF